MRVAPRQNDLFHDALQHPVHIRHDIVIPKPQDYKTGVLQNPRALGITRGLFGMLTTIDFNDKLDLFTKKVRDKSCDRDLSAKFQTT